MILTGWMEKPLGQRRGLEIRAAGSADAAGLAILLGSCGSKWPAAMIADRLDAMRHTAGTMLIALDWGPPAGLVALHWYASLHATLPMAQIDMLLVAAEDRRRGIGRLLVKAAAQAARVAGCGGIDLMAGADQTDLRAFCLASGFSQAGSRFERALRNTAS